MAEITCRKYVVKRSYGRIGLFLDPGDTVQLPAEVAGWIERDSVGTLEEVKENPVPETKAMEEPPADRMVREAEGRTRKR